jgi:hypothetical protein
MIWFAEMEKKFIHLASDENKAKQLNKSKAKEESSSSESQNEKRKYQGLVL